MFALRTPRSPVPGDERGRAAGSPFESQQLDSAPAALPIERTRSGEAASARARDATDSRDANPRRPGVLSRLRTKSAASLRGKKASAPSAVPPVPVAPSYGGSFAASQSRQSVETPSLASSSLTTSTGRRSPITPISSAASGTSSALVAAKALTRQALPSLALTPSQVRRCTRRTRPRPAAISTTRHRSSRGVRRHCCRRATRS